MNGALSEQVKGILSTYKCDIETTAEQEVNTEISGDNDLLQVFSQPLDWFPPLVVSKY